MIDANGNVNTGVIGEIDRILNNGRDLIHQQDCFLALPQDLIEIYLGGIGLKKTDLLEKFLRGDEILQVILR